MSDRLLSMYVEPDTIPYPVKVEIERSASGQPGLLITLSYPDGDATTVVVPDGRALLAPVNEWLSKQSPSYDVTQTHPDCIHCEGAVELAIELAIERAIERVSWPSENGHTVWNVYTPDEQGKPVKHTGSAQRTF